MKPFLSLKNISKKFGDKVILNNLSLDLYEGEILGLIGRSGCGKSTLIKILVGYHPADSGTILLNGESIASKEFKSLVGYTTQDNSFYEKLSIKENMAYYANLYNLDSKQRKTRIDELLKAVQLYEAKDTLAGDISGGM